MLTASEAIIPRPCGIETEFGVVEERPTGIVRDPALANADFIAGIKPWWIPHYNIVWDSSDRILQDPAGLASHPHFLNTEWIWSYNRLLGDGGRLYLDCDHVEYSTPLCLGPTMTILHNRAGYALIDKVRKFYEEQESIYFTIYRNNVAGKNTDMRVSFASHENYTTHRRLERNALILPMISWFILRIPVVGAGKVGSDRRRMPADFQISQRADFMEVAEGPQTMHNRPIYNLRDVPYAASSSYRRVHVINGDSNMLEMPEYLRVGMTCVVLMMIEDGVLRNQFIVRNPVREFLRVSRDIALTHTLTFTDKRTPRTVVDCLPELGEMAWDYLETYHPTDTELHDVVSRFLWIADTLAHRDFDQLYGVLDWVTKKNLIERILAKRGVSWDDPIARQLDIKYHDNNHDAGMWALIASKCPQGSVLDPERIADVMGVPPPTRSAMIVRTVEKFRGALLELNCWDRISIRHPSKPDLRMTISFPDPCAIPPPDVEKLFELSERECLDRLGDWAIIEEKPLDPLRMISKYFPLLERNHDEDEPLLERSVIAGLLVAEKSKP